MPWEPFWASRRRSPRDMLTEPEILSQHQASLRQARECCLALQINAVETRPRGALYIDLKLALKRLEGTCRQLAHNRGDARWLRLAQVYMGKDKTLPASRTGIELRTSPSAEAIAERLFRGGQWLAFGELAKVFELGLRRADALATRKTERPGTLILPPWAMQ